jgi:prepilin-type processing-associated H-X9-DG protein
MKTKLFSTLAAVSAMLWLSAAWAPAQSLTYSNAVATLNPAGFWPMHEMTAAAPGDVETNYGTLGVLGNAYYPDWATNYGAFIRQAAGPLANGADQSVAFKQPASNAGGPTNSLFVPHTSPLATLRIPFTIELWYIITNLPTTSFEGDFISQCDAFRLGGFRVYFQNAGTGTNNPATTGADILFYNHTTANQGFQVNFGAAPTNIWHHMVATVDVNSNVTAYLDGVLQSAAGADPRQIPVGRYDPDIREPLVIGNGLGNQRGFNGSIGEVAIYTNALSAGDILTHYQDGTNANASASQYYNDVINDNPTIYLRMNSLPYTAPDSSTWPAVANYGQTNGTAVGNGVYTPGTMPGVVPGTAYGNFPLGLLGTNVALLSGVSSFVDAGYASAYNPTGTAPFTVSAVFRGNPTDTNRVQSIVGRGTNSWELGLAVNGSIVFNSGTNSTAVVATGSGAGDLVSTANAYNDGNWHWVVAIHNGTTNVLYVDGMPNNTNVVGANNVGNPLDVMIGSDPCYTNNPAGWGRQFAGQICEVTFFTNALTATQIQSLDNAIGIPPSNISRPVASKVGGSVMFTVTAAGPALTYQWYVNTVSNYSGAVALTDSGGVSGSTTPTVTINNLTAYYFAVAANNFGSVTSQVAQVASPLTVLFAGKPIWNQASQTNVMVAFSDALDPVTAATAGNYSLNNGASVLGAALAASNEVVLTTSALDPATAYTLTVGNVEDYYGLVQTPVATNVAVGLYPGNLALWIRADTGVTTDANNNVMQWNDLSGNANNLGNIFGPPYEPLLATNAYGDTVVRFTGTNGGVYNFLTANDAASLRITGDMSVIAVMSFATLVGGTNGEIVSKTGTAHANIAAPYDYYVAGTGYPVLYRGNDNGTVNGVNYGDYSATLNPATVGTPHIVVVSDTGNTVTHNLDNKAAGAGLLSNSYNVTNNADAGQSLFIGARGDSHNVLTGDISEMIVAGSAVSSYDIAALDQYLIAKHNLPIIIVNPNPTNIVFSASGPNLNLSWPLDHTGWTLQSQTNSLSVGISTNWVNVSNSQNTNQVVIPVNPTNNSVFYRLIYQP